MNLAIEGRLRSTETCTVKISMPKIDISSKINLISIMKDLGISDAFDEIKADYSPISNMDNLCLNKAEQTTRITMDEDGVEAASAVEMGLVFCGLGIHKYRNVSFNLDRPFLSFVSYHGCAPIIAAKIMNPIEEGNN